MKARKPGPARRALLLLVAAVVAAGVGYFIYVYFQVRHVRTEGNARFTSAYISALADVPENTHMFQVDEEQIRVNIQNAEPYLEVLQVREEAPDTVVIVVEERHPAALLPYAHQYLLIDINTDVLELEDSADVIEVPVVEGISVDAPQIGVPFETEDSFKVTVMQELLSELDARDLFSLIAEIDLTNINNIRMTSVDGLTIRIGQAERIADKIKWVQNRLPALSREGQSAGTLDVSSGSFATYTMYDGGQTPASSQPSGSPGPSGDSTDEPVSGSSDEPTGSYGESSAQPSGSPESSSESPEGGTSSP